MADTRSTTFQVTNSREVPVTVWVEPWGEDYTFLPGEEYRFTAEDTTEDFIFHAYWEERDLLLYAQGTCAGVTVYHGTEQLECGHNRQHRTDRPELLTTRNE